MCVHENYFELQMLKYSVSYHQTYFRCYKQIDNIFAYISKFPIFITYIYIKNIN